MFLWEQEAHFPSCGDSVSSYICFLVKLFHGNGFLGGLAGFPRHRIPLCREFTKNLGNIKSHLVWLHMQLLPREDIYLTLGIFIFETQNMKVIIKCWELHHVKRLTKDSERPCLMQVQSINLVSACMNHLVRRKLPLAITGSIKIVVLDTGI